MASLTAETQELLKDIEEAIDKATRQSKKWIDQIPIPPLIRTICDKFIAIVLYKPPVGIVTLYTTSRLIMSGRLFRLYSQPNNDPKASVEAALAKQQQKASEEGRRALLLDPDDVAYQRNGGVDPVRQQVCAAALQQPPPPPPQSSSSSAGWALELQKVLKQVIQLQNQSSRLAFLQEASPLLAKLESLMGQWSSTTVSSSSSNDDEQVMLVASYATQVRVMDALLRLTRDRLLQTTHRLGRTVSYWQKRVHSKQAEMNGWWFQLPSWLRPFRPQQALEQERLRLAYASAAYQHERTQLGKVVQLLLERPADLPSDELLNAYKESKRVLLAKQAENSAKHNKEEEEEEEEEEMLPAPNNAEPFSFKKLGKLFGPRGGAGDHQIRFKLPSLSKEYYIRWRPEPGKSFMSLRHVETGEELDPKVAARVLLNYESKQEEPFAWHAKKWTQQARDTICTAVQESLRGSPSKPKYDLSIEDFEQISFGWCRGNPTSEDGWKRVLL